MKRLFMPGARPSWQWPGRCEWNSATEQYIHHREWPDTTAASSIQGLSKERLEELILCHAWQEDFYSSSDPLLCLQEGL